MDHDSSTAPDVMLVARMAQGDLRAVQRLCQRYGSAVYALAYDVLADPSTATEVVADTFQRAWRTAAYFDAARGSVFAWLTGIAGSLVQDALHAPHPPRRSAPARRDVSRSRQDRS